MNNIIWVKTILSLKAKLPKAIKSVDNIIDAQTNRMFYSKGDALADLEKMRLVILKKKNLQYIGLIYDQVLEIMPQKYLDVLKHRCLYNVGFQQIADQLAVSLRTAFRRHDVALENFGKALIQCGYTNRVLDEEFGSDVYISREYNLQKNLLERSASQTKPIIIFDHTSSIQKREQCNNENYAKVIEMYMLKN